MSRSRLFFVLSLSLLFASCKSGVTVDASRPPAGTFADAPAQAPFMTGIMLHNALPVMTTDELGSARGAGLVVFDPADPAAAVSLGSNAADGGPWGVRALAVEKRADGPRLWAGTIFDGAYVIDLDRRRIENHFTAQNTGTPVKAAAADKNKLQVSLPPGLKLPSGDPPGLLVNTEVFRTTAVAGGTWELRTYASHDLPHSLLPDPAANSFLLLTGLPDNTVNDILIDGGTVWLATGTPLDKGLAGGVAFIRRACGPEQAGDPQCFGNRRADNVFNTVGRYNWQRSNAALSLARQGDELWSGWSEIRGARNWGGVSGNLLSFKNDGSNPKDWHDHTLPVTLRPDDFNTAAHVSVTAVTPVTIRHKGREMACVLAATLGINNTEPGMGFPGRRAEGGNGVRVICDHLALGVIAKEFEDQRPRLDGLSSNLAYDLTAGRVEETGELWAIAASDAGLSIFEVESRLELYTSPRPLLGPVTRVGSRWLDGVDRGGEVLHGFTLGSASFPACLPEMRVQAVEIAGGLSELSDTVIRAATMSGLAEYRGPFLREALMDCRNWSWYRFQRDGAGVKVDRLPADAEFPDPSWLPVAAVVEIPGPQGPRLAVGLAGVHDNYNRQGEALRSLMAQAEARFPARAITAVRTHFSMDYEAPQELTILPDSAAINLYTPAFHRKGCSIENPECLAGDTTLNWKHFDRLYDALISRDLPFILCFSTLPVELYLGFVAEGPCAPPKAMRAECAPSRAGWDFRRWENLIFAVTDHLYRRYGREKSAGLALEVWNEAAISWNWPWPESFPEDYALIFRHAQSAVHACNAYWDAQSPDSRGLNLQVAGPTWHGDPILADQRLTRTLEAMRRQKTEPDFLTYHFYPFRDLDYTRWYEPVLKRSRASGFNQPIEITEYNLVAMQANDGTPTLGAGELPALSFVASAAGFYRSPDPPRMMYFTDIVNGMLGIRGNFTSLFQYLGTRTVAPRPAWNALELLAQAGELPVAVEAGKPARAMARLEPRTGRYLVFVWHNDIKKVFKETIPYSSRRTIEFPFDLTGLPRSGYRAREWRIDGDHANVLTAVWREGSPDQPDSKQTESILAGARLAELGPNERLLPAEVRGDLRGRLTLQDNSIWAIELAPSPALAAAAAVAGPRIEPLADGGLRFSWAAGAGRYAREYHGKQRDWTGEKQEWQPAPPRCAPRFTFNGEARKLTLIRRESGAWALTAEDGSVAVPLPADAGEPACFIDSRLRLHLAYERGGAIAYQVVSPRTAGASRNADAFTPLAWMGGTPRVISAYEPWPAVEPRDPAVAADAAGVHVVWVEKQANKDYGRPEALVYQFLR